MESKRLYVIRWDYKVNNDNGVYSDVENEVSIVSNDIESAIANANEYIEKQKGDGTIQFSGSWKTEHIITDVQYIGEVKVVK